MKALRRAWNRLAGSLAGRRSEAVPVSQLRVSALIQYKIRNAYDWIRRYAGEENEGPRAVLTSIAKREIMRQCAGADVMGLIGIIIASLVNIFVASSALQFAISVIGVLVFTGLTALGILEDALHDVRPVETEEGAAEAIHGRYAAQLVRQIEP